MSAVGDAADSLGSNSAHPAQASVNANKPEETVEVSVPLGWVLADHRWGDPASVGEDVVHLPASAR
jgi:hypothetical protein